MKWESQTSKTRRGQSLILVVFTIFVFAGIMALTLDFGFVLLARRQMQTGVNTAAVEGLRYRDQQPPLETLVALLDTPNACPDLSDEDAVLDCLRAESGCGPDDECLRNYIRRKAARHLLRLNFDDDFNLNTNSTTIGAGIATDLTQGDGYRITTLGDGSQGTEGILANRSSYIYRPDGFELNVGNADHGDMRIGQFLDPSVGDTRTCPDGDDPHLESADYCRTDFRSETDFDYQANEGDTAFLVRMRRTPNPADVDPGVSSNGGGIPLLTGRLALFSATSSPTEFSIRRDGTTVRVSAIGNTQPAVWIGLPDPARSIPGAIPFAIRLSSWPASVAVGDSFDVANDGNAFGDVPIPYQSIGATVPSISASSSPTATGYLSVVEDLPGVGSDVVIGFAHVSIVPGGVPTNVTITIESLIAETNASPRVQDAWSSLAALDDTDRDTVRSSNRTQGLLQGFTLVRTIR